MSTMLGTTTFDAQMSDYPAQGDLDVLMQAHSTDPWTAQDDGIMEEDTSFSMLTAKNPDSATVTMFMPATTEGSDQQNEVEMEDYEHHSEYEMLDESEVIVEDNDHSTSTVQEELLDVEVVDIQPSPEASLTMAAPPALEAPVDEAAAHQHSHSPLPPPPLDIAPEVTLDVPPGEPVLAAVEHPIVEGAISETVVTVEGDAHETEAAVTEPTASDRAPHEIHASSVEVDHAEVHHLELPFAVVETDNSSTVAPSEHASHDAEDHVPSGHQVVSEHHHEAEAAIDEVDVGDHVEVESNPHEIADGVFIEPVPAVVVQASFSDQPFVLFNRPPASRAHSPSPDDDVPSDIAVLLHDRPTLYYDPLSELFAALREEELVAQQPDMHHIELGFSIETLQLSIFEDNTHAKEFSLFQLNTLHDSFHTGSLRVTLLQQAPRFITRYHELREHLHHLGVNTNDDGLLTAVPSSTGESIAEQREVVEQVAPGTEDMGHHDEMHHQETKGTHHEQELNHPEGEDQQHEHAEQVKEDEQEVVEEVLGHEGVEPQAQAGEPVYHTNDTVPQHEEQPDGQNGEHGQVEDAQSEVQDGHAEVGAHAQGPVEEAEVPEQPHETEQPEVDHSGHGAGPFEESEEVTEDLTAGAGDEVAGDHDEHAQEAGEGGEAEDGVVEGVDNVTEGGDEHEYQEGEHEHEGSEQLEEEYGVDYDPDQVDADELQEGLETGDDSEHSGDGTYEEETQEADPATNGDDSEDQGYADERSPSPGAEDELPPIDTSLFEAVVAEGGEASASTQDEWLGEGYSLTGEELQDSETQHSHSEGDENAENYIGDNILVYAEGDNEDAEWDQDLDGEGEADPSWEDEYTGHEIQVANDSTPSVRSKRGFHEVDGDDEEVNELGPTPSPESKRSRLE
ncbi:hypothetical protein BKA70DRAFT_1248247 [Coprinopsis sp. MPI-PUGE-AT-0042]|nr:hypothetical protein BKA70DRAFT_1248247 [Coprinopsis sp. MPI-PUGE-AT-0042]